MKNRKKNTGLHLQASVWEADKKSIRERILSWIPVLYMILGVYGWMITALGIFQIHIQDAWLYGVLVLMGLWFGILYRIQKNLYRTTSDRNRRWIYRDRGGVFCREQRPGCVVCGRWHIDHLGCFGCAFSSVLYFSCMFQY